MAKLESSKTRKKSRPRKIRYAVVGLGYISQVAVLPAFAHAQENSELVALVSGDEVKVRRLAKRYRIDKTYAYESYADCLESGEIDAVYIALPNSMHRAYAEGAARAGVHVLCEKPMAPTEQDCEAMIDAAERANVKLMIAYRLHFEKGNLFSIAALQTGKIGQPRIFSSNFCQQVSPDNSRLRSELDGGPLYDVGVYCINAARGLFRSEPTEVVSFTASSNDKRFDEVPEMSAALMRFPDDRLATFCCSFGSADRSAFEVIGTKGVLKMDPAYEMVGDLKSEITTNGRVHKSIFPKRDQFAPELKYFSECILKNREPEPGGLEGLADVRIIGALLESQKTGRAIKIEAVDISQRPSARQEIHKPPISAPKLVRAAAPSA
jgi:glucose-fructose oxidoreductase